MKTALRRRTGGPFAAIAVAFAVVMAGGTLPTPLYPVWAHEQTLSALTVTLIYTVYAVATVATVLVFGRVSDAVGRRRVLLAAIAAGLVSAGLFVFAGTVDSLYAGRIFAGVAVGFVSGAATAALVESEPHGDRRRAAVTATFATMLGLGTGPLLTGMAATWMPDAVHRVFLIHGALLLLAAAFFASAASGEPAAGPGHVSLRPRLGIPAVQRRAFLGGAAGAFAGFALQGFFSSLTPQFIELAFGHPEPLASGAVPFVLFAVAGAVQLAGRRFTVVATLRWGLAGLLVALAILPLAVALRAPALFFVAALPAGAGSGLVFQAALAVAALTAAVPRRGDVTSTVYASGYAGLVVPILFLGFLTDRVGAAAAAAGYAGLVAFIVVLTAIVATEPVHEADNDPVASLRN